MIRTIIHTPWGFMRWLRFTIGLYLIFVGITEPDLMAGSIGVLFSLLAVFNQGCGGGRCTNGNCATPK